jgi:hypothetical protein
MKAADRALLREKFGGRCAYCGEPLGERWHADHVEPVIRDLRFADGKVMTTGKLLRPQKRPYRQHVSGVRAVQHRQGIDAACCVAEEA